MFAGSQSARADTPSIAELLSEQKHQVK